MSSSMPSKPNHRDHRDRFAHRSEAQVAEILDYYGVRWEYEPTTFVLEESDDGSVRECFTPDFYLPDYDLYLELTTQKPSLAGRKNQKLRKLREQRPDVNIKLFRVRDVHRLMVRFGLAESSQ